MTDAEFEAGKANVQTGLNMGCLLGYEKGYADALRDFFEAFPELNIEPYNKWKVGEEK